MEGIRQLNKAVTRWDRGNRRIIPSSSIDWNKNLMMCQLWGMHALQAKLQQGFMTRKKKKSTFRSHSLPCQRWSPLPSRSHQSPRQPLRPPRLEDILGSQLAKPCPLSDPSRAQDFTEFLGGREKRLLFHPQEPSKPKARSAAGVFYHQLMTEPRWTRVSKATARPAAITACALPNPPGALQSRAAPYGTKRSAHPEQEQRAQPRAGGAPAPRNLRTGGRPPLPAPRPRWRRAEMAATVPGASRARAAALLVLVLGCCGAALARSLQVRGWGSSGRAGQRAGGRAAPWARRCPRPHRLPSAGRELSRGLPAELFGGTAGTQEEPCGHDGHRSWAAVPSAASRRAELPPAPPGAAPWAGAPVLGGPAGACAFFKLPKVTKPETLCPVAGFSDSVSLWPRSVSSGGCLMPAAGAGWPSSDAPGWQRRSGPLPIPQVRGARTRQVPVGLSGGSNFMFQQLA